VLVCLPVLFCDMIDFAHALLTDSRAQSLIILEISSFLFVLSKPTRCLPWRLARVLSDG